MTTIPGIPSTPRELYDALPETMPMQAEIIEGRLVVSPMGTPEHGEKGFLLAYHLKPLADKRGWRVWPGTVDICIAGPREPLTPDFTMAPRDCPRWGDRELLSTGLVMVGEIVSPGSLQDDRDRKPRIYARAGIPLMLLVDPISDSATVTIHSDPSDGRYRTTTTVNLGESLHIPDPVDVDLDTSSLVDD